MNTDYAKKRRQRLALKISRNSHTYGNQRALLPAWAWMVAGLLLGLVLSGIFYVKTHTNTLPVANLTLEIEETGPKNSTAPQGKKNRMHFDFYTLLPTETEDQTVVQASVEPADPLDQQEALLEDLPPDELKPATEVEITKPTIASTMKPAQIAKTSIDDPYIIQTGSFRNLTQAEELKAKLVISGFQASIQTFKKNGYETWHRVYLGPFSSKEKTQLQQIHVEQELRLHSLVVKNRV